MTVTVPAAFNPNAPADVIVMSPLVTVFKVSAEAVVANVLLAPVIAVAPVSILSILLSEPTITAELAVRVPCAWSSIATYKSPPIVVTAELLG